MNTTSGITLTWNSNGTAPNATSSPGANIISNGGLANLAANPFWDSTITIAPMTSPFDTLNKRLECIEERLLLLNTNSDLEKRWPELAELRQKYRECERNLIEKEKIVDILKK